MKPVIRVENLSKQYRLGEVGTGTISHDLNRWWHKVRGKPDPYLKIGETNDRTRKGTSELVWALKDISFEVQEGEVLGIIGKNGAGKSTLLKILSRITGPTTGRVQVKGRIASLLEVGTGFHPELTGRENIYLNGTILGMRKREVDRKLDEIVDFAGVERYLDTPVKRYSSGMMVRLGFAVAAHLDPEILIVDEVLAVGDAEFQKKYLGKMKDVSTNEGRTVLFVSHNMAAVEKLCENSVLMDNGSIQKTGFTAEVVNYYFKKTSSINTLNLYEIQDRQGNGILKFVDGIIYNINKTQIQSFDDVKVEILFSINKNFLVKKIRVDIGINNIMGERICWLSSINAHKSIDYKSNKVEFYIYNLPLAPGDYNINLYAEVNDEVSDWIREVIPFSIIEKDYYASGK